MYLRYVLPEFDHGIYDDTPLDVLPEGLINYYEEHWRRIRAKSENAWIEYQLPIVVALSIVKEPVILELISKFSKVNDLRGIQSVLHEWQQFLYERKAEYRGVLQKQWGVYHDSFREFIAGKDEVEDEHVNLKEAHGIIADSLMTDLFGDDQVASMLSS